MKIFTKAVSFTTILLFAATSLFSQNKTDWWKRSNNRNATFYQVQQDFYNHWQGKTIRKGKGYKVFKRWEAYMEPRVFPSGSLGLPATTYQNFLDWQQGNASKSMQENMLPAVSNWTALGPFGKPGGPSFQTGAGRINFVRFDPTNSNTMYVGAPDGGLWKSTNGGASWAINSDFLTIIGCSDLAIDPSNTNTMYLATGDIENDRLSIGILKSTNGGATWNATALTFVPTDFYKISKLLMHPTDPLTMIAATNGGIFRTTDGWANWTHTQCCADFKDMEFKPGDPNVVYAAGTEFWKSTDNGLNWTQVTTGLPVASSVSRIALGVSPGNSSYVYALIGKSSDQSYLGMYRSNDSGATFTLRSSTPNLLGYEPDGSDNGGQAFYDLAVVVAASNAEEVITGGVNQWKSTDGGTTWNIISHWFGQGGVPFVHADVHELNYLPGSSTTVFSGNDGGFFKSTDSGATWTDLSNNLAIAQQTEIGLSQTNANFYVTGHQDNGTNLHSGSAWTNIFGGDGGDCFVSYNSNDTVYFSYVNADFHRSDDGGVTNNTITTGLSGPADFYSRWYMDPVNSSILYAGGRDTLFKSTNKGDNWTKLDAGFGTGSIKAIAVAPSNNAIVYSMKSDGVSKSTNGGVTLNVDVTGTLPVADAALSDMIVSNTDPNKIWVCFSGYSAGNKVFKSTNGGSTWTNISAGLPNLPMNSLVYVNGSEDDAIYVGADIGAYYYDNTLSSWEPFSTNLPNVAVRDLEIFYPTGKLRAATYGRGAWESDLNSPICAPNLVVTGNPVPAGTYRSLGDLTSQTATVNSSTTVTYKSNTGLLLNPLFEVLLGGVFEAIIEACTGTVGN